MKNDNFAFKLTDISIGGLSKMMRSHTPDNSWSVVRVIWPFQVSLGGPKGWYSNKSGQGESQTGPKLLLAGEILFEFNIDIKN